MSAMLDGGHHLTLCGTVALLAYPPGQPSSAAWLANLTASFSVLWPRLLQVCTQPSGGAMLPRDYWHQSPSWQSSRQLVWRLSLLAKVRCRHAACDLSPRTESHGLACRRSSPPGPGPPPHKAASPISSDSDSTSGTPSGIRPSRANFSSLSLPSCGFSISPSRSPGR